MTFALLDRLRAVEERLVSSTMLILRGSPALSPSRLQKLLQDLDSAGVPVRAIAAEYVHVAELTRELSPEKRAVLEKLLTYGPSRAAQDVSGVVRVIAPRPGTISPWSSKATDIAHICGLENVRRIERVIKYTIAWNTPVSGAELAAVTARLDAKLHDRMTQAVFNDLESTAVLFSHNAPRPMT